MKLELRSFRTRVARRIFVLFVLCALLPISAMAVVSYLQVRSQLLEQARSRLCQESKIMAISFYERLSLLQTEIRIAGALIASSGREIAPKALKGIEDGLKERFHAAALIGKDGRLTPIYGNILDWSGITPSEKDHLESGKTLLRCRKPSPGSETRVFMATFLVSGGQEIFLGEIKASYLWDALQARRSGTEVYVLDPKDGAVLASSAGEAASFFAGLSRGDSILHSGYFEWEQGGKRLVGGYWKLYLRPNYFQPEWLVTVLEPADEVFASMADFRSVFPVILTLSLALVFALSSNLIRRSLVPIEVLKDATRRIGDGVFGHEVVIRSGDEFETLASSFNHMSAKVKEGQDLLVKAAKLSTMGQMAAAIMHEVKQPLTAISGLIQLALLKEASPDGKERLETAMLAVNRLNGILTRFKSFSRMSDEVMQSVSVMEVLEQVTRLLEHQLMTCKTECVVEHEGVLPNIIGDHQALQQVFSNLLINAADALDSKTDGARRIKIRTHSRDDKVVVEVEDNGCGIPKEIQGKIFDPFFSTKPAEKGTGLGMAIIESILAKHHASIHLESEVGVGTKFTLVFPSPSASSTKGTAQDGTIQGAVKKIT
jgi:signal transduction histidine kinase